MHPILIQIGPLEIRWYGAMILYAVIGAIIGARLYYVAFSDLTIFWKDPLSVFAIWEGGLAIHGALLGGLLVSILYTRKQNINLAAFLDTLTPPLILGQAIGRIGCFLTDVSGTTAPSHPTL
jgi:phosphatidylglycerol:prolipoprotein diacylglycerol transferase